MRFEPVLSFLSRLVRMAGVRVDGRDHPIRGDLPGDPPPPIRPIGTVRRFHVLTGDQRQQRDRVLLPLIKIGTLQGTQDRVRVGHEAGDQFVTGRLVIPRDIRLPWLRVIMTLQRRDDRGGGGDLAGDPADLGDQLRDGVLPGHRVVQDRGIQRPPRLPRDRTGLADHIPHRVEDPVRSIRRGQPSPPIRQRRRVKPRVIDREPARRLPPQIERDRVRRLPIRVAMQRLQHQHGRGDVARQRRPTPPRGEQVREHLIREQPVAVLGEEREHAPRPQQMPRERRHIQKITRSVITTLHDPSLNDPIAAAGRRALTGQIVQQSPRACPRRRAAAASRAGREGGRTGCR